MSLKSYSGLSWLMLTAVFTTLLALLPSQASAACVRSNVPGVNLSMDLGRVVVSPSAVVGDILATRTWTMPQSGFMYNCKGRFTVKAIITKSDVHDLGNKVYSTNVKGIGLRFKRGGEIQQVYPTTIEVNGGINGTDYSLANSTFTLELIKTEAITGSGTIASGQYTSYDWDQGNNPMLTTSISANSLTIVSPSCLISSGKNQTVELGSIRRSDLTGVGSFAASKKFDIQLQCNGGVTVNNFTNVKITFDGTLAEGTNAHQGVLQNLHSGRDVAQGIGVQILTRDDMQPLKLKTANSLGKLNDQTSHTFNLGYLARFYQYQKHTTAGEVRSYMTFNIDYD